MEGKPNTCTANFIYANANGIGSKVSSLTNILNSEDIDFALITETKTLGLDPCIPGYTCISKKAKGHHSGELAVVLKNEHRSKVSNITEMHDENVEVMWVKVNTCTDKPLALGVFYGKQEGTKGEEIEAQFKALLTQVNQLKHNHKIILAGDFNAKLHITKNKVKQEQSTNGEWLQELVDLGHLEIISLNDKDGAWTRVNRANPQERSVIDYILTDATTKDEVSEIEVDEKGHHRLRGNNGKESDHNTILFSLDLHLEKETKFTKVWKKADENNWKKFNTMFNQKWEKNEGTDYTLFENTIIECLLKTIGKKKINTLKGKEKETEAVTNARKKEKRAQKGFQPCHKNQKPRQSRQAPKIHRSTKSPPERN